MSGELGRGLLLSAFASLLAEGVAACSPIAASPSPAEIRPTARAAQSPVPPQGAASTPTVTPTTSPTPTAPLPPDGPYLVYTHYDDSDFQLMQTGPQGIGRAAIDLPEGGFIWDLQDSLSSNGHWLAYFTGSSSEPFDLTLHVKNLVDGRILPPIRLISDSHFQQLSVIVTALPTEVPGFETDNPDMPDWRGPVDSTFRNGITSLAWSPADNRLAFVAQTDGPSSDVYVLDPETGSITRLSDDLLNSAYVLWSPDGKWVLYRNLVPDAVYDYNGFLFAANSRSTPPVRSSSLYPYFWWDILGWISHEQILMTGAGDTGPLHDLSSLQLETGKRTALWPDVYEAYAIDPQNRDIAVSAVPSGYDFADPSPHVQNGLYLVSFGGSTRKISDTVFWRLYSIGGSSPRFIGFDGRRVLAIGDDGSEIPISDLPSARLALSPDGAWFALYGDSGIELFKRSDLAGTLLTTEPVSDATWQPDSTALFFTLRGQLMMITVPDGNIVLVDDCHPGACWLDETRSTWRP